MSTPAWTTVCSAIADDFLWLVPMKDQPFRGRPYKTRLAFQILSLTVKRARNYSYSTAAYFVFSLLLALNNYSDRAELLPYIPYITWLYGLTNKRVHWIGSQIPGIITYAAFSRNVGAWGMWACSLFLSSFLNLLTLSFIISKIHFLVYNWPHGALTCFKFYIFILLEYNTE